MTRTGHFVGAHDIDGRWAASPRVNGPAHRGECPHGTPYDATTPARRLRGAHPRHRRGRRDARVVPGVRLLGHLLPGAARRPRRPQARPAPHPLHDERHGPASRPRPREERPRRRRGHGPAAPARRRRDLRRPGPDGPAVVDAAADDRRARQLRLARRLPRRDALHRVPDGAAGGGDDRLHRRGHRRLQAQLRQPRARAVRAALGDPQPHRQRHHRHRGRHGHQHRPAQPGRGGAGAQAPDHPPEGDHRRPDALHPRPRPAQRRQDRRARGHPRRLRDRPRHLPHARHRPDRVGDPAPQGHRGHRDAVRRRHREGRRADQDARAGQEDPGHRRRQGPHRPREGPAPGHRGQERLRPRGPARTALQADAAGGLLRHQHRRPGRRPAPHPRPQGAARGLRRPPLRRRTPPLGLPPRQGGRPAAPRRRPAHRDPRHRRGHPGDPVLRQRRRGEGAADRHLRPQRSPGRLHPRHAAAPADEVQQARAGEGGRGAAPHHRGARRDPAPTTSCCGRSSPTSSPRSRRPTAPRVVPSCSSRPAPRR